MKRETLKKREQLLNRISGRDYKDLLQYVSDLYLSDYQVKVLMARKCSNFYMTLLPFVLEEDGGRVQTIYKQRFPDADKEPVVISSHALGIVEEKIKNRKCTRVLLADDIILHGRTLSETAKQIKKWFEKANVTDYAIQIMAYAESDNGIIVSEDGDGFLEDRIVTRVCAKDEWRAISNRIVSVLRMSGQPYTSYVPNCRIAKDSPLGECLTEAIASKGIFSAFQTDADIMAYDMSSYSFIEETEYRVALNCSIRVYDYGFLEKYILVPMVMLNPITKDVLDKYFEELKNIMPEQSFSEISALGSSIFKYRAVVYLTSAVLGWDFIKKRLQFKGGIPQYDVREERMNFYYGLIDIKKSRQNDFDFSKLSEMLKKHYKRCDIDGEMLCEPGVNELEQILDDLHRRILMPGRGMSNDSVRALIGKFLNRNGEMDEARCANADAGQKKEDGANTSVSRLMGYPVINLYKVFSGFKRELSLAILYAIDFGKGSIVPKCLENEHGEEKKIFSVIHAGEQNYKYYANTYFPFLYGLYRIERTCAKVGNTDKLSAKKKEFVGRYREVWEKEGHFFFEEDMKRLEGMNVTEDFGEVLDHSTWDYFADGDVNRALQLSKEILDIH